MLVTYRLILSILSSDFRMNTAASFFGAFHCKSRLGTFFHISGFERKVKVFLNTVKGMKMNFL